jgi:hypothetical protein
MVDIQYTTCSYPKITMTNSRVSYKFPENYNTTLMTRVINFGEKLYSEVYKEKMYTLRGQFFFGNEDMFYIDLFCGKKLIKRFVE